MDWAPATRAEVKQILIRGAETCDIEQKEALDRYGVEPCVAPIVRYGRCESVLVVARKDNEVIYWEDVEEGFNLSPVDERARSPNTFAIRTHWAMH
jgi:hypothetical protein